MASPHRSQVLPLVVLGTPEHPQGRHSALPMLVSVQGWAKGVAASKLGRLLVSNHPKRCAVLRLVSISSATRAHEEERKHICNTCFIIINAPSWRAWLHASSRFFRCNT